MQLFRNGKGQVCGFLKNGTYFKEVVKSKHFFQIYNAYGIDLPIVRELIRKECKYIRLREKDTKRIYQVTFQDFYDYSFVKEWGHGQQHFLPMKYWKLQEPTLKLF